MYVRSGLPSHREGLGDGRWLTPCSNISLKRSIMEEQKPLWGKTVVITGASSGIGRAMAYELARQGAKLVLAARRTAALEEVAAECESMGSSALVVPTDVTDEKAVHTLAATAHAWGGGVDVWINNAGVLAAGAFEQVPLQVHRRVIETNLLGYITGAHAVLPYFKQQGHGILINNISVGGWFPSPYAAGYTASKFGLRGYSEALKGELTSWPNIHVCDLYPPFLDTPGIQHAGNYTGKTLKPSPPVYDPVSVARKVAHLILHPRSVTTAGIGSPLMKLAHDLFPGLSRRITASLIRTYLKSAPSITHTSGNLYEPLEYGSSVHGGWRKLTRATNILPLALLGGVLLLTALAGKKS